MCKVSHLVDVSRRRYRAKYAAHCAAHERVVAADPIVAAAAVETARVLLVHHLQVEVGGHRHHKFEVVNVWIVQIFEEYRRRKQCTATS